MELSNRKQKTSEHACLRLDEVNIIRRTLIDIASRRQRPGTGSERKFLTKRTTQVIWPDLTEILKPIPWAVV
ncbi:MAG: hypothetical protein ACE5PV_26640, partial [Candidatus Poribacteria bacterium]